jgi:hypothetical protein
MMPNSVQNSFAMISGKEKLSHSELLPASSGFAQNLCVRIRKYFESFLDVSNLSRSETVEEVKNV